MAPAQPSPARAADLKPPPLSPPRAPRLLPVLAGIVGILIVSVAWLLMGRNPVPEPTPVRPQPIPSNDEPRPNSDKPAPSPPSPANPSDSGNFSIIFGTENDPKSAMYEINKAKQLPNSPHPILYKKSGQWMSIASFDTPEMRDQQLKTFRARFSDARPQPLKLSSLCPNSRLISAETADMAEQRDCGS
jgi:hypothetical protein